MDGPDRPGLDGLDQTENKTTPSKPSIKLSTPSGSRGSFGLSFANSRKAKTSFSAPLEGSGASANLLSAKSTSVRANSSATPSGSRSFSSPSTTTPSKPSILTTPSGSRGFTSPESTAIKPSFSATSPGIGCFSYPESTVVKPSFSASRVVDRLTTWLTSTSSERSFKEVTRPETPVTQQQSTSNYGSVIAASPLATSNTFDVLNDVAFDAMTSLGDQKDVKHLQKEAIQPTEATEVDTVAYQSSGSDLMNERVSWINKKEYDDLRRISDGCIKTVEPMEVGDKHENERTRSEEVEGVEKIDIEMVDQRVQFLRSGEGTEEPLDKPDSERTADVEGDDAERLPKLSEILSQNPYESEPELHGAVSVLQPSNSKVEVTPFDNANPGETEKMNVVKTEVTIKDTVLTFLPSFVEGKPDYVLLTKHEKAPERASWQEINEALTQITGAKKIHLKPLPNDQPCDESEVLENELVVFHDSNQKIPVTELTEATKLDDAVVSVSHEKPKIQFTSKNLALDPLKTVFKDDDDLSQDEFVSARDALTTNPGTKCEDLEGTTYREAGESKMMEEILERIQNSISEESNATDDLAEKTDDTTVTSIFSLRIPLEEGSSAPNESKGTKQDSEDAKEPGENDGVSSIELSTSSDPKQKSSDKDDNTPVKEISAFCSDPDAALPSIFDRIGMLKKCGLPVFPGGNQTAGEAGNPTSRLPRKNKEIKGEKKGSSVVKWTVLNPAIVKLGTRQVDKCDIWILDNKGKAEMPVTSADPANFAEKVVSVGHVKRAVKRVERGPRSSSAPLEGNVRYLQEEMAFKTRKGQIPKSLQFDRISQRSRSNPSLSSRSRASNNSHRSKFCKQDSTDTQAKPPVVAVSENIRDKPKESPVQNDDKEAQFRAFQKELTNRQRASEFLKETTHDQEGDRPLRPKLSHELAKEIQEPKKLRPTVQPTATIQQEDTVIHGKYCTPSRQWTVESSQNGLSYHDSGLNEIQCSSRPMADVLDNLLATSPNPFKFSPSILTTLNLPSNLPERDLVTRTTTTITYTSNSKSQSTTSQITAGMSKEVKPTLSSSSSFKKDATDGSDDLR